MFDNTQNRRPTDQLKHTLFVLESMSLQQTECHNEINKVDTISVIVPEKKIHLV